MLTLSEFSAFLIVVSFAGAFYSMHRLYETRKQIKQILKKR